MTNSQSNKQTPFHCLSDGPLCSFLCVSSIWFLVMPLLLFSLFKKGKGYISLKLSDLVFTLLDSKVCCRCWQMNEAEKPLIRFPFEFSDLLLLAWFCFLF